MKKIISIISPQWGTAGTDITKNGIVPEIYIINDIKDNSTASEKGRKKKNSENFSTYTHAICYPVNSYHY